MRPRGVRSREAAAAASRPACHLVSMWPGATALTVTPRAANSAALLRVRPITPALAAL